MKKTLLKLLIIALICISAITVHAETQTFTPESNETYDIRYTDCTQGKYYALLVVDGKYEKDEKPTVSEDTVLYISQATADANGDVAFSGWEPKDFETATVYLGGTDFESPKLLGYLGSNTFVVAGTVTSDSGTTYEATITLTDAENNAFAATSLNGTYAIEVAEGTYTFKISVKNHLSYTDDSFTVTEDINNKDASVLGGDIDGNGVIEFTDLLEVLNNYEMAENVADINGDGEADFTDLLTVLNNYEQTAVVE